MVLSQQSHEVGTLNTWVKCACSNYFKIYTWPLWKKNPTEKKERRNKSERNLIIIPVILEVLSIQFNCAMWL